MNEFYKDLINKLSQSTRIYKNNIKLKGISYIKKSGKYQATISYMSDKRIHVGTYATIEEAVEARRKKVDEMIEEIKQKYR